MKMNRVFVVLTGVAALLVLVASGTVLAAPSQTGQGIMVNITTAGNFAFTETQLYSFNVTTASTYYSNVLTSGPTFVSSAFTGPDVCPPAAPAVPSCPAPDSSQVAGTSPPGIAVQDKCIFLDGGNLSDSTYSKTVTSATTSCTVGPKTRNRTDTYTCAYTITGTDGVAAFTAWDLVDTNGPGAAHIGINADIAGESVLQSTQFPAPGKFSFSLVESDGVTNRVQNLAVSVNSVLVGNPGSTIATNCPGCLAGDPGAVDFTYTTNAGSNGNTSLLKNGDARTLLNSDSHNGNNNGGADGSALAIAHMDEVPVALGEGSYTVSLTGSVKGNTATAGDISFSVSKQINVVSPGCSNN
jgi:hypothetical protein